MRRGLAALTVLAFVAACAQQERPPAEGGTRGAASASPAVTAAATADPSAQPPPAASAPPPPTASPPPEERPPPVPPLAVALAASEVRYVGNTGGDGVALRSACGDADRLIGGWPEGTEVLVAARGVGPCDGWRIARAGSTESWIRDEYLAVARVAGSPAPTAGPRAGLPPLPDRWPSTFELGMSSGPGDAQSMTDAADFGFRYQYLAGGVNTGAGWASWNPGGSFVTAYIEESREYGLATVFTYYMIRQSRSDISREPDAVYRALQDPALMAAYFADLRLFFERAAAFPDELVVLHVEPDMWGFIQQRSAGDDAATVSAVVASSGLPELAGLTDNASGLAQAIVELRDRYAPSVLLGFHLSSWASGDDFLYSDPADSVVEDIALRSATFYRSLGADFDVVFAEFSDRDAAFKETVYGDGGAAWWDEGDFDRQRVFLRRFVAATGKRIVLWQIPYGNTRMRAMNNTRNHFQDNKVERLLSGDPANLDGYMEAGVVALLFGAGGDGATSARDAAEDGVTNPPPINDNDMMSLGADDDGGYFRWRATEFYAREALPLP